MPIALSLPAESGTVESVGGASDDAALPDHFESLGPLGSGGFGAVLRVRDLRSGQVLALKQLRRADPNSIYRFKQEFRLVQGGAHAHLVRLHELFLAADTWCFTMDLVEGIRFDAWVRPGLGTTSDGPCSHADTTEDTLPPDDGAPLLRSATQVSPGSAPPPAPTFAFDERRLRVALPQLIHGVLELHAKGILHRDLKPSNVLVRADGTVVILDFGLAIDPARLQNDELPTAGTPAYMSPEQSRGAALTPASDWYSVGVMLYEALTGRLPFGGTMADMLRARRTRDPRDPRAIVPGLPDDLAELATALLRREPLERPDAAALCARIGLSSDLAKATAGRGAIFIGRERELEAIGGAFRAMRAGATVVAHVHGHSGLGKTTLVQRFLSTLPFAEGALVLEGRCYERESVPFKAIDDLVDALGRHLGSLRSVEAAALMPRDTRALVKLFPSLGRLEVLTEVQGRPPAADPFELRRRAFQALRELLARLSDTRPLVLVLEDVHWGDPDSADLVRNLLAPPDVPRLLLIVSYRDALAEENALVRTLRSPQAGDASWQSVDVEVLPLAQEQATELALSLLGGSPEDAPRAEHIAAESAHSPLLVEQLAHAARKSTALGEVSMKTIVQERTAHLSDSTRHTLELLCASSMRLTEAQIRRASKLSPATIADALDRLRDEHLAIVSTVRAEPEFEVAHDKIRLAALAECPKERLEGYHLELAKMLAERGDEPLAIAEHFLASSEFSQARKWLLLAGDKASEAAAFDQAVTCYERALERSAPSDREEALRALAPALSLAGRGPESAQAYLELAELSPSSSREHRRDAGAQHLFAGYPEEALETLKPLLDASGLGLPSSASATLAALLWRRLRLKLRGLRFQERSLAEIEPNRRAEVDLCWVLGHGLAGIDLVRSAYYNTHGVWLALELGEPRRIARALALDATLRTLESPKARLAARPLIQKAEDLAQTYQDAHALAWVKAARAVEAWVDLDLRTTEELCRDAIQSLRGNPEVTFREIGSLTVWFWMHAAFLRGNLALVGDHARAVAREAELRGDRYTLSTIRAYVLPLYWAAMGELNEGRREADAATSPWAAGTWYHQHWAHLRAHCFLDLYEGDGARALARLEAGWPRMKASYQLRIRTPRLEATYLWGRSLLEVAAAQGLTRAHAQAVQRHIQRLLKEQTRLAEIYAHTLETGLIALRAPERAEAAFEQLRQRFAAADMPMHESAALFRQGEAAKDQGAALREEGLSCLEKQGVRDAERFALLLVPRALPVSKQVQDA